MTHFPVKTNLLNMKIITCFERCFYIGALSRAKLITKQLVIKTDPRLASGQKKRPKKVIVLIKIFIATEKSAKSLPAKITSSNSHKRTPGFYKIYQY